MSTGGFTPLEVKGWRVFRNEETLRANRASRGGSVTRLRGSETAYEFGRL